MAQRFTAIVAEEDGDTAAKIEDQLSGLSCEVVSLEDANAIRALAKSNGSAVVLLSLPGSASDAARLCRQLRASPGRKYIIMLLDGYEPEAITAAYQAGADDAIAKPLIDAELNAKLRGAMWMLGLEDFRRKFEGEGTLFAEIAARASFHSRSYLQVKLGHELTRAIRFAHSISMLLAEVRYMAADDRIMRPFGRLLSEHVRSQVDLIARYNERSFAVVFPETDLEGAMHVAERLRGQLQSDAIDAPSAPKGLTVNFGIAACDAKNLSSVKHNGAQALLDSAEAYLRDASRNGPNQIAAGPVPHS
ncbi:MAG: GGDEF domain-containing response regulator [Woeseiaceae bacterium]